MSDLLSDLGEMSAATPFLSMFLRWVYGSIPITRFFDAQPQIIDFFSEIKGLRLFFGFLLV